MKLTDLITSKDGSLSITKLAASTGHFNVAVAFVWLTYTKGFIAEMWVIYLTAVVLHAGYDKTMAAVKELKSRQMDVQAQ